MRPQRPVNIVVPMAGRGSRFAQAGFQLPKPLIDVRGKPMYAWAVDSLPVDLARQLVFLVLREHLDRLGLAEDIAERFSTIKHVIVPVDSVTRGQAETVLLARDLVDSEHPLLIYNADTYSISNIGGFLRDLPDSVAGVIDVFEASGDKWSFAAIDDEGRVTATAEKRRISPWATTGLYYFSQGRVFVADADAMIAEGDQSGGEYYVAPIYNRIIARGLEVRAHKASAVWGLGTPDDLTHFEQHFPR